MACRGVHFALTDSEVAALLDCSGDEARLEHLREEIEEVFFDSRPDALVETDKAWDAIHRLLGDGTLDVPAASYPGTHVVLGGEQLHEGGEYVMSLKSPADVRAAAPLLEGLTKELLRERYDRLDPDDYEGEMGEDDFEYTWDNFADLRAFWLRAASAGLHVLFTVDQ